MRLLPAFWYYMDWHFSKTAFYPPSTCFGMRVPYLKFVVVLASDSRSTPGLVVAVPHLNLGRVVLGLAVPGLMVTFPVALACKLLRLRSDYMSTIFLVGFGWHSLFPHHCRSVQFDLCMLCLHSRCLARRLRIASFRCCHVDAGALESLRVHFKALHIVRSR